MTVKITDHTVRALARRPERDKDKTNIALLISSFADQIQETENAWYQLFEERNITSAVGDQLDDLGLIVDQPRNGTTDADYRMRLSARIAANNSDGLLDDFIRVARGVINDPTLSIRLENTFPAGLTMHIESGQLAAATADILIEFLRDTAAGGVRILLHHLTDTEANTFTMGSVTQLDGLHGAGATSILVDSTAGFADAGDLLFDEGLGTEESRAYTSKDGTNFFGVTATGFAHANNSFVQIDDSTTKGFGEDDTPVAGGFFSSILE